MDNLTFPHFPHTISNIYQLRIIVIMLTKYALNKNLTIVKENAGIEEFSFSLAEYQRKCPQIMNILKLLEIY